MHHDYMYGVQQGGVFGDALLCEYNYTSHGRTWSTCDASPRVKLTLQVHARMQHASPGAPRQTSNFLNGTAQRLLHYGTAFFNKKCIRRSKRIKYCPPPPDGLAALNSKKYYMHAIPAHNNDARV